MGPLGRPSAAAARLARLGALGGAAPARGWPRGGARTGAGAGVGERGAAALSRGAVAVVPLAARGALWGVEDIWERPSPPAVPPRRRSAAPGRGFAAAGAAKRPQAQPASTTSDGPRAGGAAPAAAAHAVAEVEVDDDAEAAADAELAVARAAEEERTRLEKEERAEKLREARHKYEEKKRSLSRGIVDQVAVTVVGAASGGYSMLAGAPRTVYWLVANPGEAWVHVKKEAVHYWHGFRLFGMEVSTALRLGWRRLSSGEPLSRREARQLRNAFADCLRMVPFLPFIVIPAAEVLLPVALAIFPNMLPSTFECADKRDERNRKIIQARLRYSKFLNEAMQEWGERLVSESDESKSHAREFHEFIRRVRAGAVPANEEIIRFAPLFSDELTLDNLDRAKLVAMCRFMDIPEIGSNTMLRSRLRAKLKRIKVDDAVIVGEGVDSLSYKEVQEACRARGMPVGDLAEREQRANLARWLELSMDKSLPSSLLLLTSGLLFRGMRSAGIQAKADAIALAKAIREMPDEVVEEVEVEHHLEDPEAGAAARRLEHAKTQQKQMREESEERKADKAERKAEKEREAEAERLAMQEASCAEAAPEAATEGPAAEVAKTEAAEREPSESAKVTASREKVRKIAQALKGLSEGFLHRERSDFVEIVDADIEGMQEAETAAEEAAEAAAAADEAEREAAGAAEKEKATAAAEAVPAFAEEKRDIDRQVAEAEAAAEAQSRAVEAAAAAAEKALADAADAEKKLKKQHEEQERLQASLNRVRGMLQSTIEEMDKVDAEVGEKYKLLDVDQDGRVTDEEIKQAVQQAATEVSDEDLQLFLDALPHSANGKVKLSEVLELAGDDDEADEEDADLAEGVDSDGKGEDEAEAERPPKKRRKRRKRRARQQAE